MRRLIAATLTLAGCAAPAAADIVHLRGGGTVEGQLHRLDAVEWIVYAPDRRATFVPVEPTSPRSRSPPAANTDPDAAAAAARRPPPGRRPRRTTRPPPSTSTASSSPPGPTRPRSTTPSATRPSGRTGPTAAWSAWATRWVLPGRPRPGPVRLPGRRRRRPAAAQAGPVRRRRPLVAAALAVDPDDVSALYLQRPGATPAEPTEPAARAAFEAVAAAVPDHAPTRVNLAVIDAQQGRPAAALARYDEAMTLTPAGDPAVLARVSAALAAVAAAAVRRNPVVARVAARFHQQDQLLAARLTAQGLHRFGTAWLTDAQLADVRRGQAADAATLDRLSADFDRRPGPRPPDRPGPGRRDRPRPPPDRVVGRPRPVAGQLRRRPRVGRSPSTCRTTPTSSAAAARPRSPAWTPPAGWPPTSAAAWPASRRRGTAT